MDIAGAKALKERLGSKSKDEAPPVVPADLPDDAPPVYQWTGVSHPLPQTPPIAVEDDEDVRTSASLFRRLGLSFR